MERSFGLFFYLKKNGTYRANEVDIYLRITVNGISAELSTKRKCEPTKWNVSHGRVDGKSEYAKSINSYLEVLQRKVHESRKYLLDNDIPITAVNIKQILRDKEINQEKRMLMEIFSHHNNQIAALVDKDYSPATLERYKTSFRHTQSFLEWKYKVSDIDIQKLDYEFISEYEFWLKSTRRCDHNTTMKYLGNFRKIVNRCVRHGWLIRDPFLGFNMTKKEVERTALTETELNAIMNQELTGERLSNVRDIFIFSCFSGLSYADVKKMKRSEIIIGIDGEKWLVSKRQKTNVSAKIPLLPIAINIIDKYANHRQCLLQDRVLPVLSNQKMNSYLKEIAEKSGVNKVLTYHIARHTFATTVTLSNGVPIETVSKMLGHRNIRTTQHYAKILDRKISDDMKRLREKFS
ncbi:MAG: site-specific integrase [Bacteroidetes bacterium]|nr:site-specific integrase [Bacteroidota bacterium]